MCRWIQTDHVLCLGSFVLVSVLHLASGQTYNQINQLPWFADFTNGWDNFIPDTSTNYHWKRNRGETPSKWTGPEGDHTGLRKAMPSSQRYYLFVEASHVHNGTQSRLRSPNLPQTSESNCLEFFISVYGQHIGSVLIESVDAFGNKKLLFNYTGDHERNRELTFKYNWLNEEVTLPVGAVYFNIVAVRGGTWKGEPYGDIAVDDVQITPGPCERDQEGDGDSTGTPWLGEYEDGQVLTYNRPSNENCEIVVDIQYCTFDVNPPRLSNMCEFINDPEDDLAWYHRSGPTRTAKTGPTQDYTKGNSQGYYLYLEASGSLPGEIARLFSPDLTTKGGPFCLTFTYHMYGLDIGSLKVILHYSTGMTSEIWVVSGDQENLWRTSPELTIPEGVVKISFEASRGGSPVDPGGTQAGDIGLDNVLLRYPGCESIRNCDLSTTQTAPPTPVGSDGNIILDCNMEDDNCNFVNDGTRFLWFRNKGPTPTDFTGPNFDHTLRNEHGYYMYTEATNINGGEIARLLSPNFPGGSSTFCVSFWYYSYGEDIGIFSLNVIRSGNNERTEWSINFANQPQSTSVWTQVLVQVQDNPLRMVFQHQKGMTQNGPKGDLAIDDIAVTAGNCRDNTAPPPPPSAGETTPQQWVGENNEGEKSGEFDINSGFQDCETEGAILTQCDFEENYCNYATFTGDFDPWFRGTSQHGQISNNSPLVDRTKGQFGDNSGYFIYYDGRSTTLRKAVLTIENLDRPGVLQFWYYSQGDQHDAMLVVLTGTEGTLAWGKTGSQGEGWQYVTTSVPNEATSITFEARPPTNGRAFIAVDDIVVKRDCQEGDTLGGYENEQDAMQELQLLDVSTCAASQLEPGLCPDGTRCFIHGTSYFCVPGKCKKKTR